jgi:hypothetical protein
MKKNNLWEEFLKKNYRMKIHIKCFPNLLSREEKITVWC